MCIEKPIAILSKLRWTHGGGGEKRTPVRKPVNKTFYERSQWLKIPFPGLPLARFRFQ